jgi:RNA polymerase sigma factor (sigma-70 family)
MKAAKRHSDDEIIRLIRSGEALESSVSHLYAEHLDNLTHFIRKNSGNQQDAEDVFQETIMVFVDLVQRGKFRGESSIKTFLYAIARNLWLNAMKKRNRMFIRDTGSYEISDDQATDLQQAIIKSESKRAVLDFIGQLGETCKKVLISYYYEDRSMKEICEQMRYESEQVVRNQKYKCMKKLIDWIGSDPVRKNTLKELLLYGNE